MDEASRSGAAISSLSSSQGFKEAEIQQADSWEDPGEKIKVT